jgi:hypothetical protein
MRRPLRPDSDKSTLPCPGRSSAFCRPGPWCQHRRSTRSRGQPPPPVARAGRAGKPHRLWGTVEPLHNQFAIPCLAFAYDGRHFLQGDDCTSSQAGLGRTNPCVSDRRGVGLTIHPQGPGPGPIGANPLPRLLAQPASEPRVLNQRFAPIRQILRIPRSVEQPRLLVGHKFAKRR